MAARSKWLRVNVDFDDSEWISALSESGQLAWIKFLAYVKKEGRSGKVRALTIDRLAAKFAMKPKGVKEMFDAGRSDGAIRDDEDHWAVTNWSLYQAEDATGYERLKRFREKSINDNGVIIDSPTNDNGDNGLITALSLPKSPNDNGDNGVSLSRATTDHLQEERVHTSLSSDAHLIGKNDNAVIKKDRTRFQKPTIQDVEDEMRARGWKDAPKSAITFWNFYESKGWLVGKSPMRKWQSSVVYWESTHPERMNGSSNGTHKQSGQEISDGAFAILARRGISGEVRPPGNTG